VNCPAVRNVLPEFALGVANDHDLSAIELHVEGCAACRKEAIQLQRAVTAFGYALVPAPVADAGLERRVVGAVRNASAVDAPKRAHGVRGRRAGVTLVAAAVLAMAIGVGAVMANRAERLRLQAERTALQQQLILDRFGEAVGSAQFADPEAEVLTGMLTVADGARGTGSALTIVSPSSDDQVIVIVSDLRQRFAPLDVSMTNAKGRTLELGEIRRLDTAGGATFARSVAGGLGGFVEVIVRDARGRIVLRGTLAASTAVVSASP
jgi:hypothetical protein